MQTDEFEEIPSTNFSVIRVSRDVFQRSVVGGIFVNKAQGSGQYNRTYGIDGNFSFLNHLDLTTFVLKTETPGLGNQDVAGNITAAWTDQRMELEGQYLEIGENFNPEVGFVPRVGMKKRQGAGDLDSSTRGEYSLDSRVQDLELGRLYHRHFSESGDPTDGNAIRNGLSKRQSFFSGPRFSV